MIPPILARALWLPCIILAVAPTWATPQFTDVTQTAGIDFVHVNGAGGAKYVVETVGPGAAFLDYDDDGDLDAYLINGAAVPGTTLDTPPSNALYRNQGDGTFVDITQATGTGDTGYGMGVAAADYDNDGDLDFYLANFGPNALYRNDGDRFAQVAPQAGVDDDKWGSSCAFADIDNDGAVDLYVANYHDFSYTNHKICAEGGSGLQLYCGPETFDGVPDLLYRNQGNGTFADITQAAGLVHSAGKELGVVFGDVDLDGDQDLYLASDKTLNFLFVNDGQGHFAETGLLAGAAYNEDGEVEAGMGVDMGDYDNDGQPDLFVTNFQWETNTLYRNLGGGDFVDDTFISGLGKSSIPYLSWGTRFFDVDLDGDRDLFIANGHLESDVEHYENTTFAQRNQLFLNQGDGRFDEFTPPANSGLAIRQVSRGAAFGDYDGDGDVDILVANCASTPTLLRNDTPSVGHWLRLRLQGTQSNRSAIGARVTVINGDKRQVDQVRSGASYLSQSDLRLSFGLGHQDRVDRIEIDWPSGLHQIVENPPVDQDLTLIEGQP
ncbi:MAG: hypothetical protein GKR89_05530 [Candidatus Latescibacteria bacterium]|nr:hypothetical protein [Candidatus Latescibacterota bacterium]